MNKKQPTTALGYWFRENRERLGLTQKGIAKKIGVGHRAVSGWERCSARHRRPSRQFLPVIAQLFGMSLDEVRIVTGYSEGEPVYGPVVTELTYTTTKFGCTCDGCGPRQQQCRQATIQGLPIMCETVTERDIQAARARGLEEELVESRRL